jgi:2-polyprenyl-6-methoxyphenol hydroxylase-like FAD-dependent oxidoreductase
VIVGNPFGDWARICPAPIRKLGDAYMSDHRNRHHAIVIGASMGGLLAARALADRFARVTVVERDALAAGPAQRKGVPQGEHAHGLLARGREIIEGFFPGITAELTAQGALTGEVSADVLWHCAGGFLAEARGGLVGIVMSRPLLEARVRARLAAFANVTVLSESDAIGLVASPDKARIAGLRVQRASGAVEEMAADLVVDATGGGSRTPAWLAALGYAAPAEEVVRVGIGYTTRLYRRRPEHIGGRLGVVVTGQPPNTRSGAALALEGDRWIVSAAGYFGDHAPADEAGFAAFLAGMPSPAIHDLVRAAEPISDFKTFKFGGSMRRRYEKLRRFPEGLLVFGDAISRFNPVFGQGMTSAAMQALALHECAGEDGAPLWLRFFRRAARVIEAPWKIAVGADLAYPQTEGPRGPMVKFLNWYVAKLHRAGQRDAAASLAFHKVANLTAPPPSILSPGIVWRVLRGNLKPSCAPAVRGRRIVGTQAGD